MAANSGDETSKAGIGKGGSPGFDGVNPGVESAKSFRFGVEPGWGLP